MSGAIRDIAGVQVFVCADDGPLLAAERDAVDIMGDIYGQDVDWIAIPTSRLGDDFFRLSTRIAGGIIQKFVTYQQPVAFVGDISARVAESEALADYVRECNRGRHVWFVDALDAIGDRLAPPW